MVIMHVQLQDLLDRVQQVLNLYKNNVTNFESNLNSILSMSTVVSIVSILFMVLRLSTPKGHLFLLTVIHVNG